MNKTLLYVGIIALLVGGFVGYQIAPDQQSYNPGQLGAITVPTQSTTTYGTALQESLLYQWQWNVVESLARVRQPLSGLVVTSTAPLTFASLSAGTSTASNTTTTLGGIAAALGDWVLIT